MTIPQATINPNKVVTISFSDATYTLKSFKQVGKKLIAYYYKNTNSQVQRSSNSFALDIFKPNGQINKVVVKILNSFPSQDS